MMNLVADAQVLLLSAVLTGAGLAKLLVREPAPAPPAPVHGVPEPPPETGWAVALRRSRPVAMTLGLAEIALGVALVLSPHTAVRIAAALLLTAATWVVAELRERTPGAGCGCFGGLSGEPVGPRNIVRAALLATAALMTLGGTATGAQIAQAGPWQAWALCGMELALLAVLSPEPAELLRRRQRPEVPCERRRSPLAESQAALRRSEPWRRHRRLLDDGEPLDIWREGCWRFLVYPARVDGRQMEVVFAVSTAQRDHTVHATVIEAEPPTPPPDDTTPSEPPAAPLPEDTGPCCLTSR